MGTIIDDDIPVDMPVIIPNLSTRDLQWNNIV